MGDWVESGLSDQRPGLGVLTGWDLPKAFTRAPTRLTAEQIDAISGHARRSTTWLR
jgi:hypothetical protein